MDSMFFCFVVFCVLFPLVMAQPWAVIVAASPFWYDYRHTSDALLMYEAAIAMGIPRQHIILMLGGPGACNPRNLLPGTHYGEPGRDVYPSVIHHRGKQVTAKSFVSVLTDRQGTYVPRNHRLLSTSSSDLLVFISGHGGRQFIEFADGSKLTAQMLGSALADMKAAQRFRRALVVVDTCRAETMGQALLDAPDVAFVGSSRADESAYSVYRDSLTGVSLVDRFSLTTSKLLPQAVASNWTLAELMGYYDPSWMLSHPVAQARNQSIPRFGFDTNSNIQKLLLVPKIRPDSILFSASRMSS